MEQLQPVLNEILQTISDTLGYSVDTIKSNAGEYLLEYSKYEFIHTMSYGIGRCIILGTILGVAGILAFMFINNLLEMTDYYLEEEKIIKICVILFLTILIGFVVYNIVAECIVYFSSPEMYGIRHLMKYIK